MTEKEPFLNIIYRRLINNQDEFYESFHMLDLLNLFIFVLPNSLIILYNHLKNMELSFLIQNCCVFNVITLFLCGNFDVIIIGILNVIILATKFSADFETYTQFPYWFDFFGIEPPENFI